MADERPIIVKKIKKVASTVAKPLGGMLKGLAQKALPFVGGALGSIVPGVGTAIGTTVGTSSGGPPKPSTSSDAAAARSRAESTRVPSRSKTMARVMMA